MTFTKKVRLYFDQCDPAAVAFHGQHSLIAQRVFEDSLSKMGISWTEWFAGRTLFFPVAQLNIKYTKPLFPGKEYLVRLRLVYLGKSSLHGSYRILNSDRILCCSLFAVYVCVNKEKMKSRPFPKPLASRLKSFIKADFKT